MRAAQLVLLALTTFWLPLGAAGAAQKPAGGEGAVVRLSLTQAVAMALQTNRSLQDSRYNVGGQRLAVSGAESVFDVKVFPRSAVGVTGTDSQSDRRLEVGTSVEKRFYSGVTGSVNPRIEKFDDGHASGVDLSVDIPLLRGRGAQINRDPVLSSQYGLRTSERNFHLTQINTVLDTVSAVYEIIRQQELAALYQAQVDRLQAYAESARIKEKAGLASPLDTYRAAIRLKDAQTSLNLAQEGLRNGQDNLKVILAMPLERAIEIEAPLAIEPVQLSEEEAVRLAMAHRVELKQAEDDLTEAVRRAQVSKDNLLPQLNLEIGVGFNDISEGSDSGGGLDENTYQIGLVGDTDWSRTLEKTQYRQSLLQADQSKLALESRREAVKQEVRRRLDALDKLEKRLVLSTEQIQQAEGKRELAGVKYRHGLSDNFDLIEADSELQSARVNLLSAKTEYILGIYQMQAAMGTLLQSVKEGQN